MKYAIATCMSSDDYILGVINLFHEICQCTDIPFILLCTDTVYQKWEKVYARLGINCMITSQIELPEEYHKSIQDTDYDYWKNTFIKLNVFNMVQYDRIIYIDSDMMVLKNFDEAFEKPPLAAVDDGVFMNRKERSNSLNSGFMVISPDEKIYRQLLDEIPYLVKQNPIIGDQDVIQKVYAKNGENFVNLGIRYNANAYLLDSYDAEEISIVHYISKSKPWNWNWFFYQVRTLSYLLRGRRKTYRYTRLYYKKLMQIKRDWKITN